MDTVLACVDEPELEPRPEPCPYAEPKPESLILDPAVNVNVAERTTFFPMYARMTFVVV